MSPARIRRFAIIALVLLGVAGAAAICLWNAARWLNNPDPPVRADAIVVLSGRYERSMYAADLYRQGFAPLVVLSEEVPNSSSRRLEEMRMRLPGTLEIHRRVLQTKGVPADKIEVLGKPSLSTSDEAIQIAARFGRSGRRILVVTSPSHILRSKFVIARALEGRGVALAVCATPYEEFPDPWWRSQDAARDVLLEWAKLAFYFAGGRFSAQD